MRRLVGGSLVVAAGAQVLMSARVLGFAVVFRFLPAELRDGRAAAESVRLAIEGVVAESEMVA